MNIPMTTPKPQPPEELSVRGKVFRAWEAIKTQVAKNKSVKIEILQISLKLKDAEQDYKDGLVDDRFDWRHDLASARYLHEGMLKWAEMTSDYHLYSTEYWREISRKQYNTASEYTLSGINALLLFNGGVALGCLGGLVSGQVPAQYKFALSFGIWAAYIGLVLCAITIVCVSEWLSDSSRKISYKLINPPTSGILAAIRRYSNRCFRKRGKWLDRLPYVATVWFFLYVLIGMMIFFDI